MEANLTHSKEKVDGKSKKFLYDVNCKLQLSRMFFPACLSTKIPKDVWLTSFTYMKIFMESNIFCTRYNKYINVKQEE